MGEKSDRVGWYIAYSKIESGKMWRPRGGDLREVEEWRGFILMILNRDFNS